MRHEGHVRRHSVRVRWGGVEATASGWGLAVLVALAAILVIPLLIYDPKQIAAAAALLVKP